MPGFAGASPHSAAFVCPPPPALQDSFLDEGFILDKKIGVGQPKRITDAKVLIANTPMDTDKIKIYGARVRVDSMAKVGWPAADDGTTGRCGKCRRVCSPAQKAGGLALAVHERRQQRGACVVLRHGIYNPAAPIFAAWGYDCGLPLLRTILAMYSYTSAPVIVVLQAQITNAKQAGHFEVRTCLSFMVAHTAAAAAVLLTTQVGEIEAAEKDKMREKCQKIINHGINCFINRQLIYNFPEEIFADAGVQLCCPKHKAAWLAGACANPNKALALSLHMCRCRRQWFCLG